jgi:hypothetical protein
MESTSIKAPTPMRVNQAQQGSPVSTRLRRLLFRLVWDQPVDLGISTLSLVLGLRTLERLTKLKRLITGSIELDGIADGVEGFRELGFHS